MMKRNLSISPLQSCLMVSLIATSVSTLSYAQLEGSITAETVTPNDAQILQIVRTLNDGEIAQAKLAQDEATGTAAKVEQHQLALETASTNLVPNATSTEVAGFLAATTPKLESHLRSAQAALDDGDCN